MPRTLQDKGYSAIVSVVEDASEVQADDCGRYVGDHGSGKQIDKRETIDSDLEQVVAAWADLPEVVKAGMLAMVEASRART